MSTSSKYRTTPEAVSWFARAFPTLVFYRRFLAIILSASAQAKRGQYSDAEWQQGNREVRRALERVGVHFEITGLECVAQLDRPCVVVANHMSMLETVIFPGIVQPLGNVTYIVKSSLLEYPVFRHVMRALDPIAVGRSNPRQDLKTVLEGGVDRLNRGLSVIVFPQTTRTLEFDPARFNTIGIKLARRANVPILPLALRTDAWGTGKLFKEFGKIDPSKKVYFAFGQPLWIQGRGADEHQAVIDFIRGKLEGWQHDRELGD